LDEDQDEGEEEVSPADIADHVTTLPVTPKRSRRVINKPLRFRQARSPNDGTDRIHSTYETEIANSSVPQRDSNISAHESAEDDQQLPQAAAPSEESIEVLQAPDIEIDFIGG